MSTLVKWPMTMAISVLAFLSFHANHESGAIVADAFSRTSSNAFTRSATSQKTSHNGMEIHMSTARTANTAPAATGKTNGKKEEKNSIRSLSQNWWPVTAISALKEDRPNAIQVLGMNLVLFRRSDDNDGDSSWVCLDDKCSHRFAPLSEGRIKKDTMNQNTLQCAYHGWAFDSSGSCQTIPQTKTSSTSTSQQQQCAVQSYPVRVEAGMVFVWTDAKTAQTDLPHDIPLSISPLLKRAHAHYGDDFVFMRDLPYGMELLGENLLDLSHLPFSHHSVGGLNREGEQYLPMKMMSHEEKVQATQWEREQPNQPNKNDISSSGPCIPMYQAQVVNAAENDPVFKNAPKTKSATTHIGYFDPHHVRYRRVADPVDEKLAAHVELFMCPIDSGRSRVFLFNILEQFLPSSKEEEKKLGFLARMKAKALDRVVTKLFLSPKGHMLAHSIFDGDGIFLHKQGNRMNQSNKTFRDYQTPSSADVLLNAFRRFLDLSAEKSLERGELLAAASMISSPSSLSSSSSSYPDTMPREVMLDRYHSHTKHCPICSKGLAQCEKKKVFLKMLLTALTGAVGASTCTLLSALIISNFMMIPSSSEAGVKALTKLVLPRALMRTLLMTSLSTILGAKLTSLALAKNDREIHKFHFEDYIHAEKD